ncbi:MAG: preprotein translocase subunit YajC [Puniceicoccales bacterium]|jgi:preprotein translocase subunit YajC|nr:preprotein translocase subunit YajC [Puniceicoccales bacterium]
MAGMDYPLVVGDVAARAAGGGNQLLIFGLIFVGMWFLLIAPNRRRQKAHQRMLAALRPGDRVLLASGIFGKILRAKESRLSVEIASGVRVEVLRSYVQRQMADDEQAGEGDGDGSEKDAAPDEDGEDGQRQQGGKPVRRRPRSRPAK